MTKRDNIGFVSVSHHDDVNTLLNMLAGALYHALFLTIVLVGSVLSACTGRSSRELYADIRVQPSVQTDVELVPEYRLDESISCIVLCKPVTVMEEDPFPGYGDFKRIKMQFHSQFCLEELPHPEVMVAGEIVHLDATIGEFLKRRQSSMESFRDHSLVFKPEIKQIANNK